MKNRYRFAFLPMLVLAATVAHAQPDSTQAQAPASPAPPMTMPVVKMRALPATAKHGSTAMKPPATKSAAKSTAAKSAAAKPATKAKVPARVWPPVKKIPFDAVTLGVRHRVFHDFRDEHRVALNEDFPLGDSDFSARVIQYLPDFQMDLPTRHFYSLSDEPNNPAFKVVVRKGKVVQDTTWAFLNNPPHFGAKSYFAFLVLKLELPGRAPVLPDTTSRLFKPGGHAPGAQPMPAHQDSTRKP